MAIVWKRRAFRQPLKICCSTIVFAIMFVYVFMVEPYCFFKSSPTANDLSKVTLSEIKSYGSSYKLTNDKNIIIMLLPRVTLKLIERLKLLDSNFDDNSSTAILFLYTSSISMTDFLRLTKIMKRQVLFLNIVKPFNLFPIGFDACGTKTPYHVRGKWNYLLMIRFWFKTLFELPQLRQYEYIMRLDDDSQLSGRWFNIFEEMDRKNAVYFANNLDVDSEYQLPGTMKIKEVTFEYVKQNNIKPKQMEMLNNAFFNNTVLNYYNNFEVTKIEFFRRREVRHWIDTIDSTYGIFKYRWGDAVLRYLTIALFAEPYEILHRSHYNLSYCHKCL